MKIQELLQLPNFTLSKKDLFKVKGGHNWVNSPSRSTNATPVGGG